MAMIDFSLTVGINRELSYDEMQKDINDIVKQLNSNPPKIKVAFDIDSTTTKALRSQVAEIIKSLASASGKVSINAGEINSSAVKDSVKDINAAVSAFSKIDKGARSSNTTLSETAKRLSEVTARLKEIDATNRKIGTKYSSLKDALGGEAATGQNATELEVLKQKYIELLTVTENLRINKSAATQEDITNIYQLQTAIGLLIVQTEERIALAREEAMAARERADAETAAAQQEENATERAEATRQRLLKATAILLEQIRKAIQNMSAAENGKSSEQYAWLKVAEQDVDEWHDSLLSADKSNKDFVQSINAIASGFVNYSSRFRDVTNEIKANGEAHKTLGEHIGNLAQKFSTWFSITRVIMATVRAIRQMVSASIELDDAMTQLKIVTKDTDDVYEEFGSNIAKTAKKIGSSITDLVDSATTYARLGYSLDESSALATYTAMLQNVGDIDVSDAQNAITAIVKAFNVDVDEIESIMDKLVATGNAFPISVAQIAEGMNNASSALAAAGNTFEQSVALLTAANTTIQDAAKSSTGLRTIAARIRNTKTELDELGEVMEEASYEELVQTLTDFNVALTDVNGEYRSTYDIMSDIAKQWNNMTSMEQAALATAMSGTRQQAVFYSIIEQFQEASGAMGAMADSAGELQKSYNIFMESTTAHINQFKAAFQELASDTFQSEFLQQFIDLGTWLLGVLDAIVNVVNALGGLNTALYVTIGLIATINGQATIALLKKLISPLTNLLTLIDALGSGMLTTKVVGDGLSRTFILTAGSANTFTMSMSAAQIAVGASAAVIGIAILAYSKYKQSLEDAAQKATEAAEHSRQNADAILDLKSKLDTGVESVEYLTQAFKTQLETMGYTEEQIEQLINKYKGLAGAISEASEETLRQAAIESNDAEAKQRNAANSDYYWWKRGLGNPGLQNIAADNIYLYELPTKELENSAVAVGKAYRTAANGTIEDIISYYEQLQDTFNLLKEESGKDKILTKSGLYKMISQELDYIEEHFGDFIASHKNNITTFDDYNNMFLENLSKLQVGSKEFSEKIAGYWGNSAELASAFDDHYVTELLKLADKVEDGEMTISTFDDHLSHWMNSQTEFSSETAQLLVSFFNILTRGTEEGRDPLDDLGDTVEDVASKINALEEQVSDLPETLSNMEKSEDVLEKAAEEMREYGEISNDTLKSIIDLMDEGENWLDYLEIENGQLKLNTELWKERSLAKIKSDIELLENELEIIDLQNQELIEQLAIRQEIANSIKEAFNNYASTMPDSPTQGQIGQYYAMKGAMNSAASAAEQAEKELQSASEAKGDLEKRLEALRAILNSFSTSYDKAVRGDDSDTDETKFAVFNWIEKAIDRIQRKIDSFSRTVSNKFKSLSTRNEAAKAEIDEITKSIGLQMKAYDAYIAKAESVNLSDALKEIIRNGAIRIAEYDEETAELINEYQQWYEAALDVKDAVDELHESLASLYDDEFNRIQTDFENRISLLEYLSNMYDTGISTLETKGYMASTEFYTALTTATEHNIELLKKELTSLQAAFSAAMDSGEVEEYSEAW